MSSDAGMRAPHVLVIDGSADLRETMEELLGMEGFRVSLAEDGEQALALLAEHPADAVVMDLHLRRGDGFRLGEVIRATSKPAPFIVAMTGRSDDLTDSRSANGAFDAFLLKPHPPEQLFSLLRNGCRR